MANPNTNTNEIAEREIRRGIISDATIILDLFNKQYVKSIAKYDRFNDVKERDYCITLLHRMRLEIDRVEKTLIQH